MPRKTKRPPQQPISSVNMTDELMKSENTEKFDKQACTESIIPDTSEVLQNESITLNPIGVNFDNLYLTLNVFKQSIVQLNQHIKCLEKEIKKELKTIRKESTKHKQKGKRKPSGFAKPSNVSSELCDFMGRSNGTQIARTEVTQYLIQYIKENDLQFKENKKVIVPDDKLRKLLGVDNSIEVNYFNLQGLMNKHFVAH